MGASRKTSGVDGVAADQGHEWLKPPLFVMDRHACKCQPAYSADFSQSGLVGSLFPGYLERRMRWSVSPSLSILTLMSRNRLRISM